MTRHLLLSTVLLVALMAIMIQPAVSFAQWVEDGIPICTATFIQDDPRLVYDGAGGAIITWRDERVDWGDIYVQRVKSSGVVLWNANGMALYAATGYQMRPQIVSDGRGGAIITWEDMRSGDRDIYAQRVDSSGTVLWDSNGVAICTAPDEQIDIQLISDGRGGAITVWKDCRRGDDCDIYAQRVNFLGTVLWDTNGVAICTTTGYQGEPQLVSDGAGGAIIVWTPTSGVFDIYAQRVDSSGTVLWATNGVPVCTAPREQGHPQLVSDGVGGAVVTWQDWRSGDNDIYVQRVDPFGNTLWATDGIPVCAAPRSQTEPQLASDGVGGAIVTWKDGRYDNADVFAQRVDSSGTVLWTTDGVAICTTTGWQGHSQLVSDGGCGAIITWRGQHGGDWDIYAEKVDAYGTVQWPPNGVPICRATEEQRNPQIISDGVGGAIIAWSDYRNGYSDIYAQKVDHEGHAPPSISFVRGDADADGNHTMFDGLRIIYWLGGSADPPPCVNSADAEDDEDFDMFDGLRVIYWLGGVADPPPAPCCMPPGDCGTDPTPGALTCESFPPCGWNPQPIAKTAFVGSAEESRLAVGEVKIEDRTVAVPVTLTNAEPLAGFSWIIEYDADLLSAKLVDNAGLVTEDFDVFAAGVNEPGLIKVAAVSDMEIADGVEKLPAGQHQVARIVFELKEKPLSRNVPLKVTNSVMAISHDRALNHQTVGGVIKQTIEVPTEFSLSQNYPNPFNPTTEITYALPKDCRVTLEIYNVLGQRVITLVDEHQTAGYQTVRWDSRDERGEAVASGVYFYSLRAEGHEMTKRMVLLR